MAVVAAAHSVLAGIEAIMVPVEKTPGSQPQVVLPTGLLLGLLGLLAAVLFGIRLTGLPNLMDNEFRVGASVLNVVRDGNWIVPHDTLGHTDKPPLLTWLSALVTLAVGRVTPFTLYLPTALATLAVSWLVFFAGRRHFGWRGGFLGGVAYLLSDVGAKQMGTVRWDGLFALTVTLAALAGFRAWMRGSGWLWFWLAAAAATLTKGPLGVLLAAFGLLATLWERRSGTPWPVRGSQLGGLLAFLAITLGWFLLAYRQAGPPLVDDMIRQELVGHVVEHAPGRRFSKPIGDLLVNFGPWSLFACVALIRIVRSPSADARVRRFERFVACWALGGLALFSLSPHNPARLLWPVIPAASLLAGRELAHLTRKFEPRVLMSACLAAGVLACSVFVLQYHYLAARDPDVKITGALQRLAEEIRKAGGENVLQFVDAPPALQVELNLMRPALSFDEAARRLNGPAPVFVAVENRQHLLRKLGPEASPLYELGHGTLNGEPYVYIVGNRAGWSADAVPEVGRGSARGPEAAGAG